ncbi:MAG: class I SAM-dependent methyltransferase [Hyphomonadaceae bacterium]
MSSYRATSDVQRLHFQASLTEAGDLECISRAVGAASRAGRSLPLRVLDVGFGSGLVTGSRFGGDARFQVHAIDKDAECATLAGAQFGYPNIEYRTADIEVDDVGAGYDLVWASYVAHHAAIPAKFLQRLWDRVAEGGALLVRTCDDAKLEQAPPNAFYRTLKVATENVPGVSNRYHGQAIASELSALAPRPAEIEEIQSPVSTGHMSESDRRSFFDFVCQPRLDYLRRAVTSGWQCDLDASAVLSDYAGQREAFAASTSESWSHCLQIWRAQKAVES